MVDFEYPFDELAERAVLGAMIKDPESIPTVLEHLREEDFYFETHRLLFSVLYKVWEDKGKDWDDIVLRSYLEKRGLLDKISMDLVYTLAHEAAEGQLLFEAIRSVKEKAGLRRLMDLSIEVLKSAQSSPDLNLLVERAIDRLQKIAEKYQPSGYSHVKEATNRVLEFLDKRRNAERLITGVPSGFLGLDKLTAGFQPSDLVVIAARPGMGKTSFMLSVVLNIAFEEKLPLAIFSLEMSEEQLVLRMLSMISGVPLQNMRHGFLPDEDWEKVLRAALELSSREIYIDDSPSLSTTDLRIKSRKLKQEKGIGIIFVDYLQLLRTPYRHATRQEEVAEISRNLKALAKELEVPVVALAQLSRQVEHRSDKRPQLADLRESGQIEQDADLIIFIHRPEVYKKHPPPEEKGLAEIIVAKQRQGPTGLIKLAFDKETTAFKPFPSSDYQRVEEYKPEDFYPEDLDF
ncbi:MAG: replicative DNA helicase [Thermocrinis sp.]|jgi:replicative DNA helicase|uniref:replicative DNA helicase n=1 Tax=Thermocrinis sp. TaxID=2024383 RepID=UPI003C0DAE9D